MPLSNCFQTTFSLLPHPQTAERNLVEIILTRIDGVGDGALAIVHDLELLAALVNPHRVRVVAVGVLLRRR